MPQSVRPPSQFRIVFKARHDGPPYIETLIESGESSQLSAHEYGEAWMKAHPRAILISVERRTPR